MISVRVLPCLLLSGPRLVKTSQFTNSKYVGDPRNAVRIFNEREVDELIILDISATPAGRGPNYELLQEIVSEAFMPVGYGGGIRSVEDVRRVLSVGIEKVIISTYAVENPEFIRQSADEVGSQSIVVCLDAKKDSDGKYDVFTCCGTRSTRLSPVKLASLMQDMGAGEIMVNAIDRDGMMAGYDIPLIKEITQTVRIPVIACGGAGSLDHLRLAVLEGKASAVAAGSLFVYHGKHRAVLVNYPDRTVLQQLFSESRPQEG